MTRNTFAFAGLALAFFALLFEGACNQSCNNPIETPQNDPSAFTACGGGVTSADGGTLYCNTFQNESCPGEGHTCNWTPPAPPFNDVPSMLRLDGGSDSGKR